MFVLQIELQIAHEKTKKPNGKQKLKRINIVAWLHDPQFIFAVGYIVVDHFFHWNTSDPLVFTTSKTKHQFRTQEDMT